MWGREGWTSCLSPKHKTTKLSLLRLTAKLHEPEKKKKKNANRSPVKPLALEQENIEQNHRGC